MKKKTRKIIKNRVWEKGKLLRYYFLVKFLRNSEIFFLLAGIKVFGKVAKLYLSTFFFFGVKNILSKKISDFEKEFQILG